MAKRQAKKKPQLVSLEGQTSATTENTLKAVPRVEVEVIAANADEPKLFENRKMYWFRPMHFDIDEGKVEGLILNKHWDIFIATAPNDIDYQKWISSRDLKAERMAEIKRKMKAKIGLEE